MNMADNEDGRVRKASEKRKTKGWDKRYCFFNKAFLQVIQELERVLLSMLANTPGTCLADKCVLDIGCGTEGTLLPML